MRMKPLTALAALTLLISGAQAQMPDDVGHHLVPKFSWDTCGLPCRDLAENERIVEDAFRDAFGRDVLARLWASSDNPPEPQQYAMGIKRVQGEYRVFALRATMNLGTYAWVARLKRELEDPGAVSTEAERAWRQYGIEKFEAEYPPDHRDVALDSCEVAIDNSLGAQVVDLWGQMLLQARPNNIPAGTVRGGKGARYAISLLESR